MIIREAKKQDVNKIADLLAELFAIESDFCIDRSKQVAGINMILENADRGVVLVAEEDGEVAGMCTLQYLISTAEGGMVGLLEDMIVSKTYRKKGIGRKLVRRIISHARSKGIRRIQLLADVNNQAALNFYDRVCFSGTRLVALRKMIK